MVVLEGYCRNRLRVLAFFVRSTKNLIGNDEEAFAWSCVGLESNELDAKAGRINQFCYVICIISFLFS